jgi:hypothetical protein
VGDYWGFLLGEQGNDNGPTEKTKIKAKIKTRARRPNNVLVDSEGGWVCAVEK